ncbi:hypothetical protein [Streptomyces cyaneofuscatus]|uniref:hypothetical protein n=1 Tax=Streptomyces cyaneofuscatus TaxID=66883 RepID=UPI00365D2471
MPAQFTGDVDESASLPVDGGGVRVLLTAPVPGLGGEGDLEPLSLGSAFVAQGEVHQVRAGGEGLPHSHRVVARSLRGERGEPVQVPRRGESLVLDLPLTAEGRDL